MKKKQLGSECVALTCVGAPALLMLACAQDVPRNAENAREHSLGPVALALKEGTVQVASEAEIRFTMTYDDGWGPSSMSWNPHVRRQTPSAELLEEIRRTTGRPIVTPEMDEETLASEQAAAAARKRSAWTGSPEAKRRVRIELRDPTFISTNVWELHAS